jgi:hypothetical protein
MSAHIFSSSDENAEILWYVAFLLRSLQKLMNGLSSDRLYEWNAVAVSQDNANRASRISLPSEFLNQGFHFLRGVFAP